jgi:hypothetical protein
MGVAFPGTARGKHFGWGHAKRIRTCLSLEGAVASPIFLRVTEASVRTTCATTVGKEGRDYREGGLG